MILLHRVYAQILHRRRFLAQFVTIVYYFLGYSVTLGHAKWSNVLLTWQRDWTDGSPWRFTRRNKFKTRHGTSKKAPSLTGRASSYNDFADDDDDDDDDEFSVIAVRRSAAETEFNFSSASIDVKANVLEVCA